MTIRAIFSLIPHRIGRSRAVPCMAIICALVAIEIALIGCAAAQENQLDQLDQLNRVSASSIHLQLQNNINHSNTNSTANITAENGYYSSHPIPYFAPVSSRTEVVNKGSSPASLHHSIQSAREVSGSSEYIVSERSYQEGDSIGVSSTFIGMKIDETVTEGKVNIGAFQADHSQPMSGQAAGSKANAWKNPTLELEEEYIGTFHISKNMNISSNDIIRAGAYSWLGYDPVYPSFTPSKPLTISADDVFEIRDQGLGTGPVPDPTSVAAKRLSGLQAQAYGH